MTIEEKTFSLARTVDESLRMLDEQALAKGLSVSREITVSTPEVFSQVDDSSTRKYQCVGVRSHRSDRPTPTSWVDEDCDCPDRDAPVGEPGYGLRL
jgi:4-diphosphocytidyl-2C-methyl-D-erythritol kinase